MKIIVKNQIFLPAFLLSSLSLARFGLLRATNLNGVVAATPPHVSESESIAIAQLNPMMME
jgi:hypothetical protein